MSSCSGPVDDELQCSICLDVFNDPVTTPCGHNFCKICLNTYWNKNKDCSCPNCKETFEQRPELKINTTLRGLLDEQKKNQVEILCGSCETDKVKAVKSCLECQSSYCQSHLESHAKVKGLQKHKLIDPVNNLDDYLCNKHEKPLELFCRNDKTPVCLICTVTDHKNHKTVTLEEESKEKKIQLLKIQTDVQLKIQDRIKKIRDIKDLTELRRLELLKMMEETQKEAEKHDEELIEDLEQEITELKKRNNDLEKISNTEDHLHFLQKHLENKDWRPQLNVSSTFRLKHLKHNFSLLLRRIRSYWWFLVVPVGISLLMIYFSSVTDVHTLNIEKLSASVLKRMQLYEVDVVLDPDTANPKLILSDDKKQVKRGDIYHELPDNPKRFNTSVCVLGDQGFSSGRFYYEVQVKEKTQWILGVARESVNRSRHQDKIDQTPENGFWTLWMVNNIFRFGPNALYNLKVNPEKVGVFVDYEEGLVSFYIVNHRYHVYSFTNQSFNEKLYPFFDLCDNEGVDSAPLIITPVNK